MNTERLPRTYGEVITINVDVQNDFALPSGALSVADGESVIDPLNNINDWTRQNGGQVVFTRDWHPVDTAHFNTHGGPWPPHCIQYRAGAAFHDDLIIKDGDNIGSKGMSKTNDEYSGWFARFDKGHFYFDDRNPDRWSSYASIPKALESYNGYRICDTTSKPKIAVLVGGLATDYCVTATALDALRERTDSVMARSQGRERHIGARIVDVFLLTDAIRAVNIRPDDGADAIQAMQEAGAIAITTEQIINGSLNINRDLLEQYPWKS